MKLFKVRDAIYYENGNDKAYVHNSQIGIFDSGDGNALITINPQIMGLGYENKYQVITPVVNVYDGNGFAYGSNVIDIVKGLSFSTPYPMLARYLDTVGDGSGNKSGVGDFSSVSRILKIQPAAGEVFRLTRMLPSIRDDAKFNSGSYGNGTTLTNGIIIRVQDDDGTVLDLTDGDPIIVNPDWAQLCFDVVLSDYGTGNETLNSRWTYAKSGTELQLVGNKNERLEVVLADNFDLVRHKFMVQGYKIQ